MRGVLLAVLLLVGCRATTVSSARTVDVAQANDLVEVFEATAVETAENKKREDRAFKGKRKITKPSGEVVEEEGEWIAAAVEATRAVKHEQTKARAEDKSKLKAHDAATEERKTPAWWQRVGWWWVVIVAAVALAVKTGAAWWIARRFF